MASAQIRLPSFRSSLVSTVTPASRSRTRPASTSGVRTSAGSRIPIDLPNDSALRT